MNIGTMLAMAAMAQLMPITEAGRARGYTPEHLGLIPLFLLQEHGDARTRLDQGYMKAAGCCFTPFSGFTLLDGDRLDYGGGDPVLEPMATAKIGDETVHFYESSWVAIVQPDRSFVVARMD